MKSSGPKSCSKCNLITSETNYSTGFRTSVSMYHNKNCGGHGLETSLNSAQTFEEKRDKEVSVAAQKLAINEIICTPHNNQLIPDKNSADFLTTNFCKTIVPRGKSCVYSFEAEGCDVSTSMLPLTLEEKTEVPAPTLNQVTRNTSYMQQERKIFTVFRTEHTAKTSKKNSAGVSQNSKVKKRRCFNFSSFRVFGDLAFLLILFTQSAMNFILIMVLTVIVDFAKDIGVHSYNEIHILLCLALPDMIGRVGIGWINDSGIITTTNFCVLSYFGYGLSCLLLALSTGFAMVMVAVFFFGILTGALLILFPRVVCENIEKKNITMALASRYILQPPMSFPMPSMIGHFRGNLHSYTGIFYILAGICFVCSVLVFLTPRAARQRMNKQKRKEAKRNQKQ